MRIIINIDGGARGNPGPAAAGVVVKAADDGTVLHQGGIYLGEATNNVAEYNALLAALETAGKLGATEVTVISDSQLLVRQMSGEYRVKNQGLLPLFREAKRLTRKFSSCLITHVRREENKLADKMVNMALDMRQNVEDAAD